MVILRSWTISLIIGILSLTIVNGQISERGGALREALRMAQEMSILSAGDEDLPKYEKLMREICNANGGAEAYDNLQKDLESVATCVERIFTSEQKFHPRTNNVDDKIDYVCSKVQSYENCIEQLTKAIDPCLDEETRKISKVFTSFTISVLNYGCNNSGEHIKTFVNDDGRACLIIQQNPLRECLRLLAGSEAEESKTGVRKFPSIIPTLNECKYFQDFERCVDEELKKCNRPSITEIGNHVVHLLYKESDCEEILSSAASPTTIINSLLVITGIAMFL